MTAQPPFKVQLERAVWHAFDEIPEEFRREVKNLDFVIEDEPPAKKHWLATYQGTSLPRQASNHYGWPSKITFYSGPIRRLCSADSIALEDEVRHIVKHELAHYFGISDDRLRELDAY